MATVNDNFTGDNAASLGANWTQIDNGWIRESGVARCATALEACEHWNASVNDIGDDQYSQAVVVNNGGDYLGVAVRMKASSGAGDCYIFYWNSAGGYLSSQVNGTRTNHQTALTVPTTGQEAKIEIIGTTVKAYINDVQVGSDLDVSGIGLVGGQPGLFGYGLVNDGTLDDFEGGDSSTPPSGGGGAHLALLGVG